MTSKADSIQEQEKLIEVLKFTPRTYKIQLWGYGGEYTMGTVDRSIYDYFKQRRLSLMDYAWDSDYADANNIPEEMQPFPAGSWYECDDITHSHGVDRNAGTLQVNDENGDEHYSISLEDIDGCGDGSPEIGGGEEHWIDEQPEGTVVFIAVSNEKGTFFEGNIDLTAPFDSEKITIFYDDIDGNEIINRVEYDGVEIENWGADTSGKSSDFGFYIAGTLKDGKWEKYKDMDDIEYGLTDWFPAKVKPVRTGKYNVKTKDGYSYRAAWNGEFWQNEWSDSKIKVTEWQGIAYDPDEHDLHDELDKLLSGIAVGQDTPDLERIVAELGEELNNMESIKEGK